MRIPDQRDGSMNQQKGHQGGGGNEARQKSVATYRDRRWEEDGARAAGRAGEQSVDKVQPGKIAVRRGHFWRCHFGVAPAAGGIDEVVGGIQALRMAWTTHQGRVREVYSAKRGQNCAKDALVVADCKGAREAKT